jgi:tetratricopeptide (TPR) repeat protein
MNPALGAAAVGLALIDAGGAEARTQPIDGVRAAGAPAPASSGNAYQDGRALLAQGDTAGAIAAFRTALVASPQSIDALNGLGVAYDRLGRYDLSRSWYDTALAIDPDAVLVLNNLGYSLYLQGQYAAAIPLLQRVAASDDEAARRAGQRVLTLIAARMRADAIEGRSPVMVAAAPSGERRLAPAEYADAAPAAPAKASVSAPRPRSSAQAVADGPRMAQAKPSVVQVEAPAARIEITSSGEQRLVLGGPAPPAELVASLGDAAPMVMVASTWTPREERRVAARAAASMRAAQAEQLAAEQAAERTTAARQLAAALDAARHPPGQATSDDAPAAPPMPHEPPPAMVMAAMRAEAPVRPDAELAAQATAAAAPAARAKVRPMVTTPGIQTVDPAEEDAAPAWLLASRRAPRPAETAAAHDEPVSETTLAFESDDGELNAFAARMRGIEPVKPAPSISTEEAVARLEGLLRRLRAA